MKLAVDPGQAGLRHEPRIAAMLWSGHDDPLLLASETFRTVADFEVWLLGQRAKWLGAPIAVIWTPRLVGHKPLVDAIAAVLVGQVPPGAEAPPPPERSTSVRDVEAEDRGR